MSRTSLLSSLLALATVLVGVNSLTVQPTEAIELPSRQRAFERSPRLIRTANRFNSPNSPLGTYQFTLEVPEDAGEALKVIKISQKEGIDTVVFKPNKNQAFRGQNMAGASIPLASVGGESQAGETTVVFDTPIEPGNTVTISVKPKRNPSTGGVYLFGVTAYPTGDNSQGIYIGSGRIHISQD